MGRSFFLMVVIFSSVGAVSTIAQTFPVRVTPVLTPPYTPFLTDYTDAGAERLTVQVILNDLTVSEFRTKLRLTIEGVGITITTNPNYIPLPIVLQGGVPQLIYGSDMADYFRLSNLVFQGLNPNDVEKNGGRLPEGIYRISIEVLDYNRNTVVSNKGSATAWMILNDPPFINLPVNNVKIKPLNPQNIVFQWTPRHRGSPNAAFTTEYEVRLVEIWPAGRNPFDAIKTSRPIFETTTESTMVVYGPAETPLVLGREYALQVRARDTGGRDVFKNDGYSEVVRFIYGDECPVPTSLEADDISTAKARMKWQGNGQNSAYLIKLREQKEGARWFSERTEQSYYNSTNLRSGTTYEYQLTGECDIYQSKESEIRTFNTLSENPNAFVCADPNAVPPPDGSPPLRELFTNDFIHAGGFDVVVNQATGSNGRFSGEGLAIVPWFNSAKVRVTFKDISVNSSYQLTAGNIESVWDANSRFMVESEKTLAEGGGKGLQSELVLSEADTLISIPGVILTITVHPETKDITVETPDGQVLIPTGGQGKTVAITDEAGNGYLVGKDGKVTKTTASDAQLAGARGEREYSTDENLKVDFLKATNTKHGLDLPQTVLAQNYQQTENGEYVAWKALKAGEEDHVAVAARGTGDITKANFKTGLDAQDLTPNAETAGTVRLNIVGKTDGQIDELLAFYPNSDTSKAEFVAGKLNMISYDNEKKNLVLVSVNGTKKMDVETVKSTLNDIYSQGVVEWTDVLQDDLSVSGIDEGNIDDGGSGVLSNYTDDMKKILRAYTAGHTLANNTYYLFLVKNSTSKNKLGYMPRKRQAGFIFVDAHNGQDMVLTMAHELGHGAFHLKHTFSEYSLSQGVTENLMDYPAKSRLDKWQWDKIHNPEAVLGLFEDDEEGALESDLSRDIAQLLLGEIRERNLSKEKRFSVNVFAGQRGEYKNINIGKHQLASLAIRVASIPINQVDRGSLDINPSQTEKSEFDNEDNGIKYLKYKFNRLDESSNGYNLDWILNNRNLVELVIEKKDEIIFENYLYQYASGFILQINEIGISTNDIYISNESRLHFNISNQTGDSKNVLFKLVVNGDLENESIQIPSDDWYESSDGQWKFEIDLPIEGHYTLQSKIGNTVKSIEFWTRPKKFAYSCNVCGRDLQLSHEKLIELFPVSSLVQDNPVISDYFVQAINAANLNTCFRQAHFFSQISHESKGMQVTVEGTNYEVESLLKTFDDNSNAKSVFFRQKFWDDEQYLMYAAINLFKKLGSNDLSAEKFKPADEVTYKWNESDDHKVTIKKDFVKDELGEYKKSVLSSAEKIENGKRALNLVYANGVGFGNGGVDSGDGYKYRGRGAIQLTGRGNYKAISAKANSLFGTNYDWESNPDEVKDNLKAAVLSASAYIINRFSSMEVLDQNCDPKDKYDNCVKPVTRLINGKYKGLDDRKQLFKTLIEGMYRNCKSKK
ncbi:MAG: hypothetical protein R2820_12130 [Cyclobacteriaceae bacterium]